MPALAEDETEVQGFGSKKLQALLRPITANKPHLQDPHPFFHAPPLRPSLHPSLPPLFAPCLRLFLSRALFLSGAELPFALCRSNIPSFGLCGFMSFGEQKVRQSNFTMALEAQMPQFRVRMVK